MRKNQIITQRWISYSSIVYIQDAARPENRVLTNGSNGFMVRFSTWKYNTNTK